MLAALLAALADELASVVVSPQQMGPIVQRQGVVQVLTQQHRATGQRVAKRLRLDLQTEPAKPYRVVVANSTLVMDGEDLVQVPPLVGFPSLMAISF